MQNLEMSLHALIAALSGLRGVSAIGKTGGSALPTDGFSDIDLFVFCDRIPARKDRVNLLRPLRDCIVVTDWGKSEHPHWGLVDSILIGSQELYVMYFSADRFSKSVDFILRGERTEREANYFYPTGRCASILGMHAFYDPDGYLERLKQRCLHYPEALRIAMISSHLPKIDDEEDFQRAIRRGDVLFFHATLDLALDHYLQALFALNRIYFPSRKRSLELIRAFDIRPVDCESRLLHVVATGAQKETLAESYRLWQALCQDIQSLVDIQ